MIRKNVENAASSLFFLGSVMGLKKYTHLYTTRSKIEKIIFIHSESPIAPSLAARFVYTQQLNSTKKREKKIISSYKGKDDFQVEF